MMYAECLYHIMPWKDVNVPELGETVEIQSLRFEVLNADSRRLRLLRVDTPEPIHRDTQP